MIFTSLLKFSHSLTKKNKMNKNFKLLLNLKGNKKKFPIIIQS